MNIQTYNAAVRAGLPVGPASLDPALALEGVVAYGSRVAGAPDDAMAFLRHAILLLRGGGGGVARTWSETALFAECAVREAHKDLRRSAAASRAAAAAPGAATSWWRSVGAPRDAGEDLARLADAAGRVETDHRFGRSRRNFKPLELGQFDVDSPDLWTNRWLSSSSRSTAEEGASKRSRSRTLKSG